MKSETDNCLENSLSFFLSDFIIAIIVVVTTTTVGHPPKLVTSEEYAWNCVCSHVQFLLRLLDKAKTYSNILHVFLCLLIFWTQILTFWVIRCFAFTNVSFGFLATNTAHKVPELLNTLIFDRKLPYLCFILFGNQYTHQRPLVRGVYCNAYQDILHQVSCWQRHSTIINPPWDT